MTLRAVQTRFRAYQLNKAGSSFSFYADGKFTLIEAIICDLSRPNIDNELEQCGKTKIDVLHITGWDKDHCNYSDLIQILENYQPEKIEYPGCVPHSATSGKCLDAINNYNSSRRRKKLNTRCIAITPKYIDDLNHGESLGYKDIIYHPKFLSNNSNDNSTVKLFRTGSFNVASLGDIEDGHIGAALGRCRIFKSEIDILILAHHGADCETNSKKFFRTIKPTIAICSSHYGNQFEHPRPNVSNSLFELEIKKFTTKTGDVIVSSIKGHKGEYLVENLKSNSTELSSSYKFEAKKTKLLSMNGDAIKNFYKTGFKGLR